MRLYIVFPLVLIGGYWVAATGLIAAGKLNSYQAETPKQAESMETYRADGSVMGGTPDRMKARTVICDSIVFDDDGLAVIQLNMTPSETKRRTAPTSADKLSVKGAFEIDNYDAATGKVTVKALFSAGTTPITVPLMVQ